MRLSAVLVITSEPPCRSDTCSGTVDCKATQPYLVAFIHCLFWNARLEQERDPVGKAVDVDAWLDVPAAQADGRLHQEGVPLQHPHVACQGPDLICLQCPAAIAQRPTIPGQVLPTLPRWRPYQVAAPW